MYTSTRIAFALCTSSLVSGAVFKRASEGPCDIYAAGGTPCVAAHSTTRALYGGYTGALYQVKRGSDGATKDIAPISAGDVAKASDQDNFCQSTTCLISIIYDQSGNGNHLTQAPPGGAASGPEAGGKDYLAGAFGAPVTLNGKKAYGMFGSPMTGYRNNSPNKVATGDAAEGIYAVFDGTHFNNRCCFDYGNAETSSTDTGDGAMEAVYFGTGDGWSGTGSGKGPWVMADLENYLYADGSRGQGKSNNPSQTARFVMGIVKGEPNHWSIRGGDATTGQLSTYFNGPRPTDGKYNPMKKEGAIVLGIGGDNSNGSQGTFLEGVLTKGYPSEDTENKVHANVVAAGYKPAALNSGDALTVGRTISLQVTTPGYDNRYISHNGGRVNTDVTNSKSASWTVRAGLGNSECFSFESVDTPGSFIRHFNYELHLDANDNSKGFGEDATFCTQRGLNGKGTTFRSWSYAARYIRHYTALGYISGNGGPFAFDNTYAFNDDVSFIVHQGF
ncbi:alpha-L-arabinofuranosidase B [Fusarium beomiforme]|uniref:Alpha-L-arabinofuranosidase n=1 Tax=Fusarium beomiforme TaxID=44412 RepID=A0A9P5B0A6_9HYPO|nr:alpha-L-arabinofuranosidase B [Fusarium beomiforme]